MNLKSKTRKRLYKVTAAALGVAAVYGVLNGEEIAAFLLLASAVLGVADKNVTED